MSELDDPSRICPQQSWRWGELPSPPIPNRTSPPKSVGSASRDVSPSDRGNEAGAVARANSEAPAGTENKGRQIQTTAEGMIIAFTCFLFGELYTSLPIPTMQRKPNDRC